MDSYRAEHTLQTVLYIARLCALEEFGSAIQLGLRPDQIETIRSLSILDLQELALSIRAHAVTVRIAPEPFDAALRIVQSRSDERELIFAMIRAGAHSRMMNALFGLNTLCFSNYRKVLELSDEGIGRPEIPTEHAQKSIWSAWIEFDGLSDKQRYLAVHRETGIPLRNIWSLIHEWEKTGLTPFLDVSERREM